MKSPMVPSLWRVGWRRQDLPDTYTFAIEPRSGEVPRWLPGQFTMLGRLGIGEAPISISGGADGLIEHTVRAVGPVTAMLCAAGPGDNIDARGPFGTAFDLERAVGRDVLVVAGGLGLAPLRPVITALSAERHRYRRVVVMIGARSPDALLYRPEIERWRTNLDVRVTVDVADASWDGDVGVVTSLIDPATAETDMCEAFVCGPEIMIRFAAAALVDAGVPPDAVQVSLERNMKCGVGTCGHCQLGPHLLCRDGAVLPWSDVDDLVSVGDL